MSGHMRQLHTKKNDVPATIIIEIQGQKRKRSLVPVKYLSRIESFLEKYGSQAPELVAWEKLAANRIAKYGKTGLILRGARYREGLSQKELARKTGISQENISKMENGLRRIGPMVARKLAKALKIEAEALMS